MRVFYYLVVFFVFLPLAEHRCFQSECVGNIELVPHDNSCSVVLDLLLRERAVLKVEDWLDRCKDLWEQTSLSPT